MKLGAQLNEQNQSSVITDSLKIDNAADSAKLMAKSSGDDSSDNTLMYVGIGMAVLLVGGIGAILLLKKSGAAPVPAQ